MTFGEKLVKLRKIKGITQDELASAVSVSRQAVYKWESCQSYPEAEKLVKLKELFNISIDDLLDPEYEVIVPEKKKTRISKKQKEAIERSVSESVEVEEVRVSVTTEADITSSEQTVDVAQEVAESVAEVVESTPVTEENADTQADVADVSEPYTVQTEGEKKRGFFSRLFGRK